MVGYPQKIPDWRLGVYAYGFERPSAIQQRAIMPIIKGECFRMIHHPMIKALKYRG